MIGSTSTKTRGANLYGLLKTTIEYANKQNMMGYKTESLMQRMYRAVYSLALMLLLPLLLLLFKKKLSMSPTYFGQPRRFSERFGSVPNDVKTAGIWVHCVSMGELNASEQLVKRIKSEYPEIPITITTTSTAGAIHAFALYKDTVQHLFLPFDIPFFMRRFLASLQPRLVLITEVEIWPNMMRQCVKRNIPLCLINARLSDASLPTYQRLGFLLRPALRQFDAICAQSQASYDNFKKMGVYKHQLTLTQNMKFDMEPSAEDGAKAKQLIDKYQLVDKPIWLAASTHDPEEKFVLRVFIRLLEAFPSLRLILVPRHPHRFDDVYLMTKASGLLVTRLSDKNAQDAQVIIVDKMGWLKAAYSICSNAFIGGSIAPKGGHNALECAMYAKCMVMGTSTFNNPLIVDMLVEKGALNIIEDEQQCFDNVQRLFAEPKLSQAKGEAGLIVLKNNRGAVDATYREVIRFL